MAAILACAVAVQAAETAPEANPEESAIRAAVASYTAAFNRGDAAALAALWSPEAVYTNPITGQQVVGRAEIEKQFSAIFAEAKGAKLEAATNSVQFISPNVAVEQGTAKVLRPDQPPRNPVTAPSTSNVMAAGCWIA